MDKQEQKKCHTTEISIQAGHQAAAATAATASAIIRLKAAVQTQYGTRQEIWY